MREVYINEYIGFKKLPVYDRYSLPVNTKIEGPAIFEEETTSTLIFENYYGIIDKNLNLNIFCKKV